MLDAGCFKTTNIVLPETAAIHTLMINLDIFNHFFKNGLNLYFKMITYRKIKIFTTYSLSKNHLSELC